MPDAHSVPSSLRKGDGSSILQIAETETREVKKRATSHISSVSVASSISRAYVLTPLELI